MKRWTATLPTSAMGPPARVEILLPDEPTPQDVRNALPRWPITVVAVLPDVIVIAVANRHYLEFRPNEA